MLQDVPHRDSNSPGMVVPPLRAVEGQAAEGGDSEAGLQTSWDGAGFSPAPGLGMLPSEPFRFFFFLFLFSEQL